MMLGFIPYNEENNQLTETNSELTSIIKIRS